MSETPSPFEDPPPTFRRRPGALDPEGDSPSPKSIYFETRRGRCCRVYGLNLDASPGGRTDDPTPPPAPRSGPREDPNSSLVDGRPVQKDPVGGR